jgi:hypothetical protein
MPIIVVSLLCIALFAGYALLPGVTMLGDAWYEQTVVACNQPRLAWTALSHGYRFSFRRVPLDFPSILQSLQNCSPRTRFVIASPLVTQILSSRKDPPVFSFKVVGMWASEDDNAWFSQVFSPPDKSAWVKLAKASQKLGQLGIWAGDKEIKSLASDIPSDLVFAKRAEEDDQAFSQRMEAVLQSRTILTIYAPEPGPWMVQILRDQTLRWVVEAAYLPLIPDSQVKAVVVDDLSGALSALLSAKMNEQPIPLCQRVIDR